MRAILTVLLFISSGGPAAADWCETAPRPAKPSIPKNENFGPPQIVDIRLREPLNSLGGEISWQPVVRPAASRDTKMTSWVDCETAPGSNTYQACQAPQSIVGDAMWFRYGGSKNAVTSKAFKVSVQLGNGQPFSRVFKDERGLVRIENAKMTRVRSAGSRNVIAVSVAAIASQGLVYFKYNLRESSLLGLRDAGGVVDQAAGGKGGRETGLRTAYPVLGRDGRYEFEIDARDTDPARVSILDITAYDVSGNSDSTTVVAQEWEMMGDKVVAINVPRETVTVPYGHAVQLNVWGEFETSGMAPIYEDEATSFWSVDTETVCVSKTGRVQARGRGYGTVFVDRDGLRKSIGVSVP